MTAAPARWPPAAMSEPGSKPAATPRAEAEAAARKLREAAALRDNLRRRKEQARARQVPGDPPASDPAGPARDR